MSINSPQRAREFHLVPLLHLVTTNLGGHLQEETKYFRFKYSDRNY